MPISAGPLSDRIGLEARGLVGYTVPVLDVIQADRIEGMKPGLIHLVIGPDLEGLAHDGELLHDLFLEVEDLESALNLVARDLREIFPVRLDVSVRMIGVDSAHDCLSSSDIY